MLTQESGERNLGFDATKTRAVLIATSIYDGSFPFENNTIPQVDENCQALRSILADPKYIGIPWENIAVLTNDNLDKISEEIQGACETAEDALLIYYAGHGIFSDDDTDALLLPLKNTTNNTKDTSLSFENVANYLRKFSKPSITIVIIDCCYSEKAINQIYLGTDDPISDESVFTQESAINKGFNTLKRSCNRLFAIASAPRSKQSLSYHPEEGNRHSLFTGELIRILKNGINNGKEYIEIRDLVGQIRDNISELNEQNLNIGSIPYPQVAFFDIYDLQLAKNIQYDGPAMDPIKAISQKVDDIHTRLEGNRKNTETQKIDNAGKLGASPITSLNQPSLKRLPKWLFWSPLFSLLLLVLFGLFNFVYPDNQFGSLGRLPAVTSSTPEPSNSNSGPGPTATSSEQEPIIPNPEPEISTIDALRIGFIADDEEWLECEEMTIVLVEELRRKGLQVSVAPFATETDLLQGLNKAMENSSAVDATLCWRDQNLAWLSGNVAAAGSEIWDDSNSGSSYFILKQYALRSKLIRDGNDCIDEFLNNVRFSNDRLKIVSGRTWLDRCL